MDKQLLYLAIVASYLSDAQPFRLCFSHILDRLPSFFPHDGASSPYLLITHLACSWRSVATRKLDCTATEDNHVLVMLDLQ